MRLFSIIHKFMFICFVKSNHFICLVPWNNSMICVQTSKYVYAFASPNIPADPISTWHDTVNPLAWKMYIKAPYSHLFYHFKRAWDNRLSTTHITLTNFQRWNTLPNVRANKASLATANPSAVVKIAKSLVVARAALLITASALLANVLRSNLYEIYGL